MNKEARKQYHKQHYKKHRTQISQQKRDYYRLNSTEIRNAQKKRKLKNPEARLLTQAKSRAKKNSFEFNITKEDIIIPKICPVLGIKLVVRSNGLAQDDTPSLDRINNDKGYVKGNIIVVSWRANMIKNKGTPDEHQRIADFYKPLVNFATNNSLT